MLPFILIPAGIAAAFFVAIFLHFSGFSCGGDSRGQRALSDSRSLGSALKTYILNAGQYPSTEQGLAALVTRPETEPLPKKWIQVVKKIPPDPWGRDYHYRALPEGDKRGFEIGSAGADGLFGTEDDISSLDE